MLTTPEGIQFARELTMEYVKQNNMLKCNTKDIPNRISEIAKVSDAMMNAVEKEFHNIKFL